MAAGTGRPKQFNMAVLKGLIAFQAVSHHPFSRKFNRELGQDHAGDFQTLAIPKMNKDRFALVSHLPAHTTDALIKSAEQGVPLSLLDLVWVKPDVVSYDSHFGSKPFRLCKKISIFQSPLGSWKEAGESTPASCFIRDWF
jgi:hypothetical protein